LEQTANRSNHVRTVPVPQTPQKPQTSKVFNHSLHDRQPLEGKTVHNVPQQKLQLEALEKQYTS